MNSKRDDKFDNAKIQEYITSVQQYCVDVNPETISEILQECDYDVNQTIARIHSGDFQDSGWQPAKTTHRKKSSQQHSYEIPTRSSNPPVQRRSPSKIDCVTIVQTLPPSNSTCEPTILHDEKISPIQIETSNVVERKKRLSSKPLTVYRAFAVEKFPDEIFFGDIQWNDDGPFVATTHDFITEQQLSSTTDFIPQTDSTIKPNENSFVEPSNTTIEETTNSSLNENYLPTNSPAFVPFQSTTNDYSNATPPMTWTNPTNANKFTSKPSTNYSQQTTMYHHPHINNYPYPPNSPVVPFVMSFDSWINNAYNNQPIDTYSYAPANYLPTNYSNQQHFYSQQKFDPTAFERDFSNHIDPSSNANPTGKDGPMKSRLSATAASFKTQYPLSSYSYSIGHAPSYSLDMRDHHRSTGSYGNTTRDRKSVV